VDFTFSAEQDELRASVRSVATAQREAGLVRDLLEPSGDARLAELWDRWTELGWPGLLVPEEHGGLGLGLVDAVVVLEELGRVTMPGPFLSSCVAATLAALHLGGTEVLAGLASGATRGTIALEELGAGDPVDRVQTRATKAGDGWVLNGLKPVVLDAASADWVLVAARTDQGLRSFVVHGPIGEVVPTMDPTRRVSRLELVATPGFPVGPDGDHTEQWRRVVDDVAVALAAELVGVGDAALAMAIGYANARVQFDVPIASHQVIQHKIVDMLHQLELGRVGVHQAAWASDVDDEHRARSAAIAKATMGEAAVMVTAENIQVHGALGFTWEHDAQLLYKRAKQNDTLSGQGSWHRQRIARSVVEAR
jgi:alkylation response protein AidB-like acyl-CoA dehydrogenase